MDGPALYRAGKRVFQVFESLLNLHSGTLQTHFTKEEQRFRLCAHSLGLHHQGHSSLDYRVRDAVLVKSQLLRLLSALLDHLENTLAVLKGDRLPFEQQARDLETQSSSDNDSSRSSNQSAIGSVSSEESTHELDFRQNGITETINALYGLAARIRSPRNRPERATQELFRHIAAHEREQYINERAEVEIVILVHRHKQYLVQTFQSSQNSTIHNDILDKYASASNHLLRRIGMANVRRRQQFIYWKEHTARISRDPTQTVRPTGSNKPATSEALFRTGNTPNATVHLATPSAISRHEHSEATSATRLDESKFRFDDNESVFSYQSHASTAVIPATKNQLVLQWPPAPKDLLSSDYFTCPYCHVLCPGRYLGEKAWKAHLIHDLQPYQCTHEVCQDSHRLYGSYREWIDHENIHTKSWHCDNHVAPAEFEKQEEFIYHIEQFHPDAKPELFSPELMAAAFRPSTKPLRPCPLCPTGFEDNKIMHEHIKGHLERLAHHCLPADPFNKNQHDGLRETADSDSQAVRNDENSQVFSETSLQWPDDTNVQGSPSPEEYTATHKFEDIRLQFQPVQLGRESAEAWLKAVTSDASGAPESSFSQTLPLRFSEYSQLPEYVENLSWHEPSFQTSTFRNSHFNVAHYNSPNFQPEEYRPEGDDTRNRTTATQVDHLEIEKIPDIVTDAEETQRLDSLLLKAVVAGDTDLTKLLLNKGANVSFKDNSVGSPLHTAISLGHLEVVRLLLARGADPDDDDWDRPGSDILGVASARGDQEIVQLLLQHGAKANGASYTYRSALQAAASKGHHEVVSLLLRNGHDPQYFRFLPPHTALRAAVEGGHKETVEVLLASGAAINNTMLDGALGTVLEVASHYGHREIVQLLLDHGADIDAKSIRHGGAFRAAVIRGHQEIVQLLLHREAAIDFKSDEFANMIRAASALGHQAVVQLLLDKREEVTGEMAEESLIGATGMGKLPAWRSPFSGVESREWHSNEEHILHQDKDSLTAENQQPYKCHTCGKGFGRENHLAKHTRIHEKTCKCPVEGCAASTAEIKDLYRHIWTHHLDYARENNIPGTAAAASQPDIANQSKPSKPNNTDPSSEDIQPHKCPVEGCTTSKSEEKDISRHIWTYHPDYAQENNISDTDRVECGWPGCWWRGRRDNLKRHKDTMKHWEASDNELVSEEKPSGVQACDWPGCQYTYAGKKKSNLKRHKDRHQHWIRPSDASPGEENSLESSPTTATNSQPLQKQSLEQHTQDRAPSTDSTTHVINDKTSQPQGISPGDSSADQWDGSPENTPEEKNLSKERDSGLDQLITELDPELLSEASREKLHSPSEQRLLVWQLEDDVKRLQNDLGEEHPEALEKMSKLALSCAENQDFETAATWQEKVYKSYEVLYGNEHPDTVSSMADLAETYTHLARLEESEVLRKKVLEIMTRTLGEDHPDTTTSMVELASTHGLQGRMDMSESLQLGALEIRKRTLGEGHPWTLASMAELGASYYKQGRFKEAEQMHRQMLQLHEKVWGKEHPDTLTSMNNLARVLDSQGKYEEAEQIHRQELQLREKVLGKEHPDTLTSMNNLALVLNSQGKYEEAEQINRQELQLREKVLGKEHPDTLTSMNNLALVLNSQGKYEEAEQMHRQELQLCEKVLGKEHPDTLTSMNNLVSVLDSQGKYEKAEQMYRQTLQLREKVLGKEYPDTLTYKEELTQTWDLREVAES
ncbi:hypothetical protein QC764_0040510 [Podospora pseudoanserina]|uniref:C2H2-type domain-containing protein n=1 Tax=Podospora pseudoanserina TaxID=2609844 RepID=A0ABR0IHX7_9PEZI|nr:hypothetical protein QC764_0040510 [Podospora pseudoanserina]